MLKNMDVWVSGEKIDYPKKETDQKYVSDICECCSLKKSTAHSHTT